MGIPDEHGKKRKAAYFLVNCKEIDVRPFHGKEEHQCAASVANASCAATAMHEGTVNTEQHGHHAGRAQAGLPLPTAESQPYHLLV